MSLWDTYKNSPFSPWGVADMFHNDDPSKSANEYMNKIPKVGHDAYDPYINEGRDAAGRLKGEYGKMLDPTTFMDEIMKHYSESQGAKYETDKLGRGIGATAAAGGIAGTPEHQRAYGEMAGEISSKDMQQYLQNALGIYGGGIKGEQDFYGKGFDASKELADLLGGNLGSQGTMAYGATQQKNMNRQALMNAIVKALGSAAGAAA
jgi:hypothetical protein